MEDAEQDSPAAAPAEDGPPPKKKRNMKPGVRRVGSKVLDDENGTSCHQVVLALSLESELEAKRLSFSLGSAGRSRST